MSQARSPSPEHSWKYPKKVVVAGSQYRYRDVKLARKHYENMKSGLMAEAKQVLLKELLLVKDLQQPPAIPWDTLEDDTKNTQPKWSFLKNHVNRLPIDGESALTIKIWNDHELGQRFLHPSAMTKWNKKEAERYFQQVVRFKSLLLLAVHFSSAPCLNASQLLSIKFRNSATGNLRDIFISNGTIKISFEKNVVTGAGTKYEAPRTYNTAVSELVVWYLWLVVPFVQRLQHNVQGKKDDFACLLWTPDPDGSAWTRSRFNTLIKTYTSEKLRATSIDLKAFKKISIAMLREATKTMIKSGGLIMPEHLKEWDSDESYESSQDEAEAEAEKSAEVRSLLFPPNSVADKNNGEMKAEEDVETKNTETSEQGKAKAKEEKPAMEAEQGKEAMEAVDRALASSG